MIRPILIFGNLLFLVLLSCKQETTDSKFDYNHKANEIIQQLLLDESCECLLEIPEKTLIEIHNIENPEIDIQKVLSNKLQLKNRKELDSLVKLSNNFELDTLSLKQKNIRIIPLDSLRVLAKDPNFCQNGILSIKKPIFNNDYKKVLIEYKYAFMCLSMPIAIYNFQNDKWEKQAENQ